jgi:hypothetical protein
MAAGLPALQTPITANRKNEIISGDRCWRAAAEVGLATVPVVYADYADEVAELTVMLTANQYRNKSNEQIIREGLAWEEIEAAWADERMKGGQAIDPTSNLTEGRQKGETAERVGKRIGLSRNTWTAGKKAVEMIDHLQAQQEPLAARGLSKLVERSFDCGGDAAERLQRDLCEGTDDTLDLVRQIGAEKLTTLPRRPAPGGDDEQPTHVRVPAPADRYQLQCGNSLSIGQGMKDKLTFENSITIMTDFSSASVRWGADDGKGLMTAAQEVADFAAAYLSEGGSLLVMVEPHQLGTVMSVMTQKMRYFTAYSANMPCKNDLRRKNRRRGAQWRPVLHFCRSTEETGGPAGYVGLEDPIKCHTADNDASQAEEVFAYLARMLASSGTLIVDPLMRSAAIGVAAITKQRCFLGIAPDEVTLARAQDKLDKTAAQIQQSNATAGSIGQDDLDAMATEIGHGGSVLEEQLTKFKAEPGKLKDQEELLYGIAVAGLKEALGAIQSGDAGQFETARKKLREAASAMDGIHAVSYEAAAASLRQWADLLKGVKRIGPAECPVEQDTKAVA